MFIFQKTGQVPLTRPNASASQNVHVQLAERALAPLDVQASTKHQCTTEEAPSIVDVIRKREAELDAAALSETFPPPPPSRLLQERIIRNFCADLSPGKVEEAGCCVCGQLKLKTDLIQPEHAGINLGLLVNPGMTRKEHFSLDDPICDVDGPIVDDTGFGVCSACHPYLKAGKIPKISLANGLWLGRVPEVLNNLTFAERMMIARVRHNRCLMRVSSGRMKMVANAIVFGNPTVKIY
ncbi:hypothetical protein BKA70DRAFT_1099582, partial [Coprinopsis sp. MPI-PUGE-AT-0042]